MSKKFQLPGTSLEANIGTFARQADGAVWLTAGKSVMLSTSVGSEKEGEYLGFFPLTVECRRRPTSVGKFPGGYIKREGRLTDAEILLSRLIDRSIRPLFPKFYFDEVQVITTLLSYDGQFPLEVLGILSSSLSLTISGLPFNGPVGAAIFARSKDSDWKVNPDHNSVETADDVVLIVGTETGICMVEANCDFISNDEIIKLMDQAEVEISKQVKWQNEIKEALNIQTKKVSTELYDKFSKKIEEALPENFQETVFAQNKEELSEKMKATKKLVLDKFSQEVENEEVSLHELENFYDSVLKKIIPGIFVKNGKRFDLRSFEKIRQIDSIVDILPMTHGSAVFTRGQTQALCSLTLGTSADAQKIETLLHGVEDKRFSLHYNFPPFSTGEVRPLRGVGRREVGHGYLAEKAFRHILPKHEEFPYTIRSVVDLLESNGSSSQATICATTLALMDGGVPIKKMISGIAMGLLADQEGNFIVLSDITGTEDAYGIMDLKVAGDENSISAIQMDIKSDSGIPKDVVCNALEQARKGREHILSEMKKCLSAPKPDLKESAPRVKSVKIDQSKIGMVIGPGGKNIKEIVAQTGAQVDIDDSGKAVIFATDSISARKAEGFIRALSGDLKVGSSYQGKVARIADFGMFVQIAPGKDGLIHISTISKEKKKNLNNLYKTGDPISVVVVSFDQELGRIGLVAPELEDVGEFDD